MGNPKGKGAPPPPDELRCRAHSKRTKERCGNWAMKEQKVCKWHGGGAKQNMAAAAERIATKKIIKYAAENLKGDVAFTSIRDVYNELLDAAGTAKTWRLILQQRVAEMDSFGYAGVTAEQIKAEVQLFERAVDRTVHISETIARLNLDERRQALDEHMGMMVADVIRNVLNDLELSQQQWTQVPAVVAKRLRELDEGNQ